MAFDAPLEGSSECFGDVFAGEGNPRLIGIGDTVLVLEAVFAEADPGALLQFR